MNPPDYIPSKLQLERSFSKKYGKTPNWGPKMRKAFEYYTPDDHYEVVVDNLAGDRTNWIDVGCGRFIFQSNDTLAAELSERVQHLHGVDPDVTIEENKFIHAATKCQFEEFESDISFDLITLRMVAEHVQDPGALMAKIGDISADGSRVVVYTIYKYSPVPILTRLIPFSLHHRIKYIFWRTEEKDTFPVAYKMNSRNELKTLFNAWGFEEEYFTYLDDVRTLGNFKLGQYIELTISKLLNKIGLLYPEVCILGVYHKMSKGKD